MNLSNNEMSLYTIRALSNLHAGSGDSSYGIVDKQVQRDPIGECPMINASSLKGAFRELFKWAKKDDNDNDVRFIFGADTSRDNSDKKKTEGERQRGNYHFFDARLLVLPVRSDTLPFLQATTPELIKELCENIKHMGVDCAALKSKLNVLASLKVKPGQPIHFVKDLGTIEVDEFTATKNDTELSDDLTSFLGDHLVLFSHQDFKEIIKRLPVIARNNLDNGLSTNLWYEEIVPRETRFYFFLNSPKEDKKFDTILLDNKNQVQIGANATIGYGLSLITKI